MRLPSWLTTYIHSLVGISVAMIVIFFTLNWLHTRGPGFVQGPAGVVGGLVSGQAYQF
jgi:hypothetical protein